MSRIKKWFNPYGLRKRFAFSILFFGILSAIVFCILYGISENLLTDYCSRSGFETTHIQKQGKSLQDYVDRHHLTSKHLKKLKKWERRQPVILMQIYTDNDCIYSSFSHIPDDMEEEPEELDLEGLDNAVPIRLADMEVTAVLYSDYTYQYHLFGTALSFILALFLFIFLFGGSNRQLIHYICKLNEEVQILEGGNLDYQVTVQGNDEITDLARSMNRLKESVREEMEAEQKTHKAYTQLITQMSHDLRTPLTGILLYLEILRSGRYDSQGQLEDYLQKIDTKAHHLKLMSDHLFEYTLDGTGNRHSELQNMECALQPVVQSFIDDLTANGLRVVSELAWENCYVSVRKDYLERIFENIESNLLKYADKQADITMETVSTDRYCGLVILNACAADSVKAESTGIGLKSIRSMMKEMGGVFTAEQTEVLFETTILFPKQ